MSIQPCVMTYDLKSFSAFCIRTYSSTLASVARIAILCMPSGPSWKVLLWKLLKACVKSSAVLL